MTYMRNFLTRKKKTMNKENEPLNNELRNCPCQGLVELIKDYTDVISECPPDVQSRRREILKRAIEELKNSLYIWKVTSTRLEDGEELTFLHKNEESAHDSWKRLSEDPSVSFVGMTRMTLLP